MGVAVTVGVEVCVTNSWVGVVITGSDGTSVGWDWQAERPVTIKKTSIRAIITVLFISTVSLIGLILPESTGNIFF